MLAFIGFLAFIVGVISLIRPLKRLGIKTRGVGLGILVAGLILIGMSGSPQDTDTSTSTESTETKTEEITQEVQTGGSIAPLPPKKQESPAPPPQSEKDYLEAKESATVGIWEVAALGKPDFCYGLGDEFFGKGADEGYLFALVPVSVRNSSKRTNSLSFAIWTLTDDRNFEYDIQIGADMYLDDDQRLDVSQVPPEAVRRGFLVFQVKEGFSALYLTLTTTGGRAKWKVY